MSAAFADKHKMLLFAAPFPTVAAADGHGLNIIGAVDAMLIFQDSLTRTSLPVVSRLAYDIIIGLDLLKRLRASIHVSTNRLQTPFSSAALVLHPSATPSPAPAAAAVPISSSDPAVDHDNDPDNDLDPDIPEIGDFLPFSDLVQPSAEFQYSMAQVMLAMYKDVQELKEKAANWAKTTDLDGVSLGVVNTIFGKPTGNGRGEAAESMFAEASAEAWKKISVPLSAGVPILTQSAAQSDGGDVELKSAINLKTIVKLESVPEVNVYYWCHRVQA